MIRGAIKSKRITIMHVTNFIAVAFFAVLIFNGHYHHDGVGMVAAATLGGEEEAFDTTTRGTMMTAVVDGVPVPTRKLLSKRSKASKPDAAEVVEHLVRLLVFTTMMDVYRSMQLDGANRSLQPSSSAAAVARSDTGVFDGLFSGIKYTEHACDGCIDFYEWALTFDQTERKKFCRNVHDALVSDGRLTEWWMDITQYRFWFACEMYLQFPSNTDTIPFPTPTTACQQTGWCPDQYDICHLNEKSGSTENYMIRAENKAKCDTESTAMGCGNCKDHQTSRDVIGPALPVPSDGFATYCQGGPCVWKTQTRQCMGLNYYSAFTTPEACADACCGDYRCAVWQFSGSGHVNQCWYGANCDTLSNYNWFIGGIRPMPQAPDCVPYAPQTNY